MDKIILFILLAFIIVVFFLSYTNEKLKQIKSEMKDVIDANKKLTETDKIKAKNRKEANEKIDNLHNGDAIDNALNVLHNNKKNSRS